MPNKLSLFWQELKRRRVHRLMAIYAGTAYVIFEASTLIFPRWGFPDWTIDLVLYLLILGAIVTFVLGWIYDVTPDGIQKTGPESETTSKEVSPTPNGWKIASYISLVVIVVLVVLNIIPRIGNKEMLEKSIAVLPFRNDSPDEEKMYFINGTMDAILDNLCKIKDLRVVSRNSVEQYRDNPKPTPEVAEEMNVAYVLEGSGQRIGDRVHLIIQLIDGKTDHHLWSKQYDREIRVIEDLIDIQSEIAQLVASEIEVVITPEEKRLIEMIPTTNITAHDYYQRGAEEHRIYSYEWDPKYLVKAEEFYKEALKYDSTYAHAYVGLASIYWTKHYWKTFFSEEFLDSVLIFTEIALKYNPQLSTAYVQKARFYSAVDQLQKAIEMFDAAIRFNPNNWDAYLQKALCIFESDLFGAIENLHMAISLNRDPKQKPFMLRTLAYSYANAGFRDLATRYYEEVFKLERNEINRFYHLHTLETISGNYLEAAEWMTESINMDSTNLDALWNLVYLNVMLEEYNLAWDLFQNYLDKIDNRENFGMFQLHRIGLIYWENGFVEKGQEYFSQQIEVLERINELGRGLGDSIRTSYDLAATYAFIGEKEKAFEYLKIYSKSSKRNLYYLSLISIDPLFNSIRNEPEFQQLVQKIENDYQAEHERVRQWLEENDML